MHAGGGDGGAHNPEFCGLGAGGERRLEQEMQRFGLSARAHDRIRKVARTISELGGEDEVGIAHLSQAVQYRMLDREMGEIESRTRSTGGPRRSGNCGNDAPAAIVSFRPFRDLEPLRVPETPMKVGWTVMLADYLRQGRTPRYRDIRDMAKRAEAAGFDSLWLYDHLLY
ncbi:MAG: hypothetical protein OXJ56_03270, partial [Rhodospirillaceae bacterium]|nr:hypothetical protein [Rhodospirillaceae bacterium]